MSEAQNIILIVDDTPTNIQLLNSMLREQYKVKAATSGEKALKIARTEPQPDIILLDIMMPEMDGFEVCKILKSKPETKDIPVIFLTAKNDTEDIVKGFKLGGVDYITKPFKREELIVRVNNHVQLKMVKDYLVAAQKETKKSRDFFMRVLYDLGKIIDKDK